MAQEGCLQCFVENLINFPNVPCFSFLLSPLPFLLPWPGGAPVTGKISDQSIKQVQSL